MGQCPCRNSAEAGGLHVLTMNGISSAVHLLVVRKKGSAGEPDRSNLSGFSRERSKPEPPENVSAKIRPSHGPRPPRAGLLKATPTTPGATKRVAGRRSG